MNLEEALQDLEENLDELAEARTVRERQREALEAARAKRVASAPLTSLQGGKHGQNRHPDSTFDR